jgi:hypothetical protein
MRICAGGLLAVVLLSSSLLFASSITDPGVKLGPGITTTYDTYAVIESLPNGDFQLLFDGQPFAFTNPFTAPFCFLLDTETNSIQCNFENDSKVDITSLTQAFVTAFNPLELSCLNAFTSTAPNQDCSVGGEGNNVVGFTSFFVPTETTWSEGGDSGFNLSYGPGFTPDSSGGFTQDTAAIHETLLNGRFLVVPEPASLGLMLSGLLGLGLAWKRKARARTR